MRKALTLLLVLTTVLAGDVHASKPEKYPMIDPVYFHGRTVWLGTCEGCHAYGTAGAPNPLHAEDWRPRVRKPITALYEHAIKGFFGPDDTYMPPRGGNTALTDAEVRSAVNYMVALARLTIRKQETKQ